MKALRHHKIMEIITNHIIGTQEELAKALGEEGFDVTQATVSRDIKELRLLKIPMGDETYRYALPQEPVIQRSKERMKRMFQDSVLKIDHSENLIVIKTLPGTAQAVASTIDGSGWIEIIGTVAGDDTIFTVVKPKEAVPYVIKRFRQLQE